MSHFVVHVPRPWFQQSIYVIALLEWCHQAACTIFDIDVDIQAEIEIRPSWRPAFWTYPESRRIVLCFLFGPVIDRWLFTVYFAVAHEYGHLVLPGLDRDASEAWANLFSLYLLYYVAPETAWSRRLDKWLMCRDALSGLAVLHIRRLLFGSLCERVMAFWYLWGVALENPWKVFWLLRKSIDLRHIR